jgi:hypothetical protein
VTPPTVKHATIMSTSVSEADEIPKNLKERSMKSKKT